MATYVNDLRLKEITTGDESGTWGTSTNTNLELIAEAFSYGTEVITTNADTHTTTIADGATDPGRSLYLKYTGTLDSACTITIGPNTVSKVWIVENGTTGSQNIILSQGSGANITIPAGDTKVVYSDGAGAGAAFVDAFASLSVVDLKVQDDLTVTDAASIGGDATITGTLGVTGVFTGTSLDISGDIDVDGTTNLDVVDIDGAVDMATTLAVAGNVDFNGDLDVDGTTNLDVVDIDGAVDMASTLTVAGDANFDSGTLFVDVSTNRVGIGTSAPVQVLHLGGASNKAIQITSSTSNAGYFGVYQDQAGFTVNRDASDGTFADAGKTEAAIVLQSQNADSFITFRTTGTSLADLPTGFIPFADLTNTIVTGWVTSALGDEKIDEYKAQINAQLDQLINPTTVPKTITD
jgi:cytoskeletal protein CcmA (bactofilin family)